MEHIKIIKVFLQMKVWLLTAITAVCFLKATSLQCSNDPCTATDYISYASCL